MNYKKIPVVIMLVAALVGCIIAVLKNYSLYEMLVMLFWVLIIFLIIGLIVTAVLKAFHIIEVEPEEVPEEISEEAVNDEGEVVEKQTLEEDETEE